MPNDTTLGRRKFAVPGMEVPAEASSASPVPEFEAVAGGNSLAVPFGAILQLLPKELLGKAPGGVASLTYSLPKSVALEQLPRGAVKVSLGDLRRAAPPGVFVSGSSNDSRLVDLPLREIISQLNPEAFARQPARNRLDVPDDVTDIFGSKGERLTALRVIDKNELKSAPPASRPLAQNRTVAERTTAAEPPASQAIRFNPNLAQQVQTPDPGQGAGAIPFKGLQRPAQPSAKPSTPVAPKAPVPAAPPSMSAVPKAPAASQVPKPVAPLPTAPASAPTLPPNTIKFPTTPAAQVTVAPVSTGGVLSISVNTVNQKWPDSIRMLVSKLGATDLEIPNELIATALKAGRVEFQWQQVATWLRPPPAGEVPLEQAATVLELPLSVVAPLFLQQSKYKAKQSSVPAGIPDLFSAKGEKLDQTITAPEEEEEEEAESTPEPPRAAPAPRMPVRVAPPPPAAAPSAPYIPAVIPERPRAHSLAQLFGEPNKKNWTPNEIVHKTITMPGVLGALIALQDGLLVAGCMPQPWKTETIAAFIPQIFGRLTQYTKELQMGEVHTVSFGVESGTLQIFNAGIIYFGALGKHGTALPVEELTLIATELSRHTK